MDMNRDEATTVGSTGSPCADHIRYLDVTVGIVTAYISNNSIKAVELPNLIAQIHAAVIAPSAPAVESIAIADSTKPAAIRKSITPNALISFIDGKPYKTLKRHLGAHGLDFESYRVRYGLPADYPMVSANYSAARSALAKDLGLGKQRKKSKAEKRPY